MPLPQVATPTYDLVLPSNKKKIMNIKVQPCKNNIGAEISCSLKTASKEEINKIKEALNGFGVVFFRCKFIRVCRTK